MAKKQQILLVALFLLSGSAFAAQPQQAAPVIGKTASTDKKTAVTYSKAKHEVSAERKKQITKIVQQAIQNGQNIALPEVVLSLQHATSKVVPLTPAQPIAAKSLAEIDKLAQNTVEQKFNQEAKDKVVAWATNDAVKRFPMAQPKDHVSFSYKQGPFTHNVDGTFYRANARDMQVNDKIIPYVDLDEATRAKFDPKFNQDLRDKYVRSILTRFEQQKNKERQKVFEELLIAQDKTNENNGYLFDKKNDCWITADEYLKKRIAIEMEKQEALAKARAKAAAKAKAEGGETEVDDEGNTKNGEIDTSDASRYNAIMESVKVRQNDLFDKYSGIDANPGFELALWGCSRTEVAYIFSKEKNAKLVSKLTSDELERTNGSPKLVEFFYSNNMLNKTIATYGTMPYDQFDKLKKSLHETLGQSAEEKADTTKDLFLLIERGDITPKEIRAKDDPSLAEIDEKLFVFRWIGENTVGILTFTYDTESESYKNVVFTKEQKSAKAAAAAAPEQKDAEEEDE